MSTILPTSTWAPKRTMEQAALDAVCAASNQLVAAGPGAGKTELLAERADFLLQTPSVLAPERRILAVSFKREAALNLRNRVEERVGREASQRLEVYTFAAWAKGLLDRLRLGLPAAYRPTAGYLTDGDFSKQTSKCNNLRDWMRQSAATEQDARRICNAASKNLTAFYLKDIVGARLGENPSNDACVKLSEACWHYALHVSPPSRLTFQMIECLAELLLRTNPKLVSALHQTYGAVFLDEFQDTTDSQYHLLHTAFGTSDALITAVGDRKQLIMGWAGADTTVFERYQRDFGVSAPVSLCYNYRSAPELVAIQAHLAQHLVPGSPAVEAKGDAKLPGECRILTFSDTTTEAAYIADAIHKWLTVDHVAPTEICVLVRKQAKEYTACLQRAFETRNISCRVQDERMDLLTEPLVEFFLDACAVTTTKRASQPWRRLITHYLSLYDLNSEEPPLQALARERIATFQRILAELGPALRILYSQPDIDTCIRRFIQQVGEAAFRQAHPQYLSDDSFSYQISLLAKELTMLRNQGLDWPAVEVDLRGKGNIPAMTIHRSKGLQYHTVVFVGFEDYSFFGLAREPQGGGEACAFFVAFSRAKQRVWITSADTRLGERTRQRAVGNLLRVLQAADVGQERIPSANGPALPV